MTPTTPEETMHEIVRFHADPDTVRTIEDTIHEKMHDLYIDNYKPLVIVLSEKAYIALCYVLAKQEQHFRSGHMLDLEYYRDVMVVLDTTATADVRVLRRPYEELAYPATERKKE